MNKPRRRPKAKLSSRAFGKAKYTLYRQVEELFSRVEKAR